MFAKLKKKIENEGGVVPTISDSAVKSTGRRDSLTSLPHAGSIQHLGISPPASVTDDNVSMQDESASREDFVFLLQKKSDQCKKLEGNISDLAALVKEKSKAVEKLETSLRQQEENGNKKLLEQKEEFEKYRDKLIERHQDEKLKLDKLVNIEEALHACQSELRTKIIQCRAAETQVDIFTNDVESLELKVARLESEIPKLKGENKERADLVISLTKDRASFEKRLDEMNKEMEEKQHLIIELQTQLSQLRESYNSIVTTSDLQKSKTSKLLIEKDEHIDALQERVQTLEQRLSEFSLSGDDQLIALQAERDLIEDKLSETRLQMSEVKSTLCDKISQLENQISSLNVQIVDESEKLATTHKMNDQMRESFHKQVEHLKSRLEEAEKRALENLELATSKEIYYKKQIDELENELSKHKFQSLDTDTHLRARIASLDIQMKELENSRAVEKEKSRSIIVHLEENAAMFADKEVKLDGQVCDLEKTVNNLQEVIYEKNKEIDSLKLHIQDRQMAGSDKDSKIINLQQQISKLKLEYNATKEAKDDLEQHLQVSEEEKERLLRSTADLNKQIHSLKAVISDSNLELERVLHLKSETEFSLRQKLESLEQMIKQNEISETEFDLHSEKIDEMSKTILSLQTQLTEKNRTVKKQEQTLKDLRVTLQRELKVQLLPNDDGLDTTNSNMSLISHAVSFKQGLNSQPGPRPQESQMNQHRMQHFHQQNYRQSNSTHSSSVSTTTPAVLSVQSSPSNMLTLTSSSSSVPSGAIDALTAHTDHVRRELDKDINFLYLKHVILKFMLSRESEAMHLIKAVSMLLNFTLQEQQLIKETLEYKMSWFGQRPSVGEGQTAKIIPPTL